MIGRIQEAPGNRGLSFFERLVVPFPGDRARLAPQGLVRPRLSSVDPLHVASPSPAAPHAGPGRLRRATEAHGLTPPLDRNERLDALLLAEVIPLLRQQQEFRDEITFVAPTGKEGFGTSPWDSKDDAEACNRGAHVEVTEILSKLVEGALRVGTCNVANATSHKITAACKAA